MRNKSRSSGILLALLFLVTGTSTNAEVEVGKMDYVGLEAFVIRAGKEDPIQNADPVFLNDRLGSDQNTRLQITLSKGVGDVTVSIRNGRLDLKGTDKLAEIEVIEGIVIIEKKPKDIRVTTKDIGDITTIDTLYEIHVQAQDTRVFVHSGKVWVFSTNSDYPPQELRAGYWVRAVKGKKINSPEKFLIDEVGLGSGSTVCIHSDCTEVFNVAPPLPPGPSMGSPPLHPPGRR